MDGMPRLTEGRRVGRYGWRPRRRRGGAAELARPAVGMRWWGCGVGDDVRRWVPRAGRGRAAGRRSGHVTRRFQGPAGHGARSRILGASRRRTDLGPGAGWAGFSARRLLDSVTSRS